MQKNKKEIINKHCYTELVYGRINKKLNEDFSKEVCETFIKKVLKETNVEQYQKIGKNFYVSNTKLHIRVTINSNTFRVITADKI